MKKTRILFLALVFLLACGCGQASGESAATPASRWVSGVAESYFPPEGHKRVGEDAFGYLDLPEEYVVFQEIDGDPDSLMQFCKVDQSVIVTVTFYGKEEDLETVNELADILDLALQRGEGGEMVRIACVVGQEEAPAICLAQDFDDGVTLDIYLMDEGDVLKYLAVEYPTGDGGEAEGIVASYHPSR